MKTKNLMAQLCACLALCALSFTTTKAQFSPALMPDLGGFVSNGVQNVNCDLAEFVMSNGTQNEIYTMAAVAWDNSAPAVLGRIDLSGYTTGGTVVAVIPAISNATRPDIIIGHLSSGWYALVVYEQAKQVKLNRYPLTLSGFPLSLSVGAPTTYTVSAAGRTAEWPHIDGYTDPTGGLIGFSFPVTEYVMSWQETISGVVTLKGQWGGINPYSVNPMTLPSATAVNIINSDVAAYTDYTGSTKAQYASFIYTKANGSFQDMYVETDLRNTVIAATPITMETAQKLLAPRIESPSWDPITTGLATWMASCPKLTNTGNYEVFEYDANTTPPTQNASTVFNSGSYGNAAIGGSVGQGAVLGASSYWWLRNSIIMHATNSRDIEMTPIISVGGTSSLSLPYFRVNNTTLTTPISSVPVAASGSSTTGSHRLAAWYDAINRKVWYKIGYDSAIHFRPTAVNNIITTGEITLYPNPTNGNIMLSGITKAQFTLLDAIGRNMGSGVALPGNPVQTAWLPAGNYFLKVSENGREETLRFVKQ